MELKWTSFTAVLIFLFASPVCAKEPLPLKTLKEKRNYAIGVNVIRNLKQQGFDFDMDMMFKGMKDALAGEKLLMQDHEIRIILSSLQNELNQKQLNEKEMVKKAFMFLEENKKKEGVVVLSSGLQYKILKAGNGRKPVDTDTVEFNYRSSHTDGSAIDNTYDTGKPAQLEIMSDVISGLREALKLMPVGSRWLVFIPPHLAYGEQGKPPRIGPYETLIYEVELIAIK